MSQKRLPGIRILCASDLHIPIHDVAAVEALIHRIRVWHPQVVVLLGDLIDMAAVSRFPRAPGGPSLQDELDVAKKVLRRLRKALGMGRLVLVGGNHENRLEGLLRANPGLYDLDCLEVPALLGLPDAEWHPEGEGVVVSGCHFQHSFGDRYARPTEQQALLRLTSAGNGVKAYFTGHSHRMSSILMTHPGGVGGVYETGCLIDRRQAQKQYMKLNPQHWHHGWLEILTDGKTYPRVTQVVLP